MNEAAVSRPVRTPGPEHPISVEPNLDRVVVTVAGKVIADSRSTLTLKEARYPAVQYFPREDVNMAELERTETTTYCPYKGDCNYYSIPAGGDKSVDAVWTYEHPLPPVGMIKGHLAFYIDRVDCIRAPCVDR